MRKFRIILTGCSIAWCLVFVDAARSQNVLQPRYGFDQGGGGGSGSSVLLLQSIGQPFTEPGSGTGVVLVPGFLGPAGGAATSGVTASIGVSTGWNMISVPIDVADFRKVTLFPTAVSPAFRFTTQYTAEETLKAGIGYWLKFTGQENVLMAGSPRPADTIPVTMGWNLIGSVSGPVPVAMVTSIPGGMVVSSFFGFDVAYVNADTLSPGAAYWVKVADDGSLVLSSSGTGAVAVNRVRIVPSEELPPDPPSGGMAGDGTSTSVEYALLQNYPNPFNPSTTIHFTLPLKTHIRLRIFNVLGECVTTLLDGEQEPGHRSIRWDATALPAGVYFYQVTAGTFTQTKKMLLLK